MKLVEISGSHDSVRDVDSKAVLNSSSNALRTALKRKSLEKKLGSLDQISNELQTALLRISDLEARIGQLERNHNVVH